MTGEGEAPNAEQAAYWNGAGGQRWQADEPALAAQLQPFTKVVIDGAGALSGLRATDIGCGWGGLTLDLANAVGETGTAVGIDISELLVERGRRRADDAGVQCRFVAGDVQTALLEPCDVVVSRFGVMFFDDPVMAFTNVAASLGAGGRLSFTCWQRFEDNPWMAVPMAAMRTEIDLAPPLPPDAPGPFSFGDRQRVHSILDRAGFVDIAVDDVGVELIVGGGSLEGAVEFALDRGPVVDGLAGADDAVRGRVAAAARRAFEPYQGPSGVCMPSCAWHVTAGTPT